MSFFTKSHVDATWSFLSQSAKNREDLGTVGFCVYIRASGAIRRAWLLDEYTMEIHVGNPRAYLRFDGFQLFTFGLFFRNSPQVNN
jgi:hypothetical protein